MSETDLPAFKIEIINDQDYGFTDSRTVTGTVSLNGIVLFTTEQYLFNQQEIDAFREERFRDDLIDEFATRLGKAIKIASVEF